MPTVGERPTPSFLALFAPLNRSTVYAASTLPELRASKRHKYSINAALQNQGRAAMRSTAALPFIPLVRTTARLILRLLDEEHFLVGWQRPMIVRNEPFQRVNDFADFEHGRDDLF